MENHTMENHVIQGITVVNNWILFFKIKQRADQHSLHECPTK